MQVGERSSGAGQLETIRLHRAHIGTPLVCEAEVTNTAGPALLADSLQTTSDMWPTGDLENTGPLEVVSLPRSRVGGAVLLEEPGERISSPVLTGDTPANGLQMAAS